MKVYLYFKEFARSQINCGQSIMSKSRLMNGFMSKGVVQGVVFLRNQCTDKTTPTV